MNLLSDFNNLVIVGHWNRHIFNPEWVGKYLLPEISLTSEFPLNIAGSFRVSTEKLRIFIVGNRLHFSALNNDPSTFDLIQDLSMKVSDYLLHTPVSSFGVNFVFEDTNSNLIKDLFTIPDVELLSKAGYAITSTSYKHSFVLNGHNINLAISKDIEKVRFDFNNHFEIKSLVDFKEEIFQRSIVSMLNDAEKLINEVYLKKE